MCSTLHLCDCFFFCVISAFNFNSYPFARKTALLHSSRFPARFFFNFTYERVCFLC